MGKYNTFKAVTFLYTLPWILFGQVDYLTEIQIPIFNQNCVVCHGISGGLSLISYETLMAGGEHGVVIIPGDTENSILVQKISPNPPFGNRMPYNNPTYFDEHPEQRQTIIDWINEGAEETISIVGEKNEFPENFIMIWNYPNPFNQVTDIVFNFRQAGFAEMTIFDHIGRVVREFESTWVEPGVHEILWWGKDGSNQFVASGLYILQVRQGNTSHTKKLVLIK